jgi:hypothetical protein
MIRGVICRGSFNSGTLIRDTALISDMRSEYEGLLEFVTYARAEDHIIGVMCDRRYILWQIRE